MRRLSARMLVPVVLVWALAGCGVFRDVDSYVDQTYGRSVRLDDGTAKAYTTPDSPAAALSKIAAAEPPLGRLDSSSVGYLQYKRSIVRVAPAAAGSVILVDSYANGYQRWASDVSPYWGNQLSTDDDSGK